MIPTLAEALASQGYDTLTPVQEVVTRDGLETRDRLVSAQTGSGKTVGFGLAIGPTILDDDGKFGPAGAPVALVIAPTRELAMQVKRELAWLYAIAGAQLASCVGGMDFRDERRSLERGAHVVVATPGRLRDHIMRGTIDMSAIRAVVLDEADEMLDLGFREDLEFILDAAPEGRRTLLFSATVPPAIAKLAESYQNDAERITTTSKEKQHSDIAYLAMQVANHDVDASIINTLRFHDAPNAIVFANTRAMVTRLTTRLSNRGFSVVALSGELTQSERSNALQSMRDGRARVCVATDVAARGIDLPNLELVIHAELPTNAETLVHRSGRTGRAGRKGISAMIVPPKMRRRAENLLKWGKLNAEWTTPPSAEEITAKDEERLLTDPVWSEEFTEGETAFAQKLLAQHAPEKIAAAYLRLYAGKVSAPEDLSTEIDTPPPSDRKREVQPFGPSRWFRIDIGREGKAEARWLLPMLCKAGGITKKEIGAIRIQPGETFIEIAEPAVAGFLREIGPEMSLENQATLTELDGAPQLGARGPRKTKRDYDEKPAPRAERPVKPEWTERPARDDRSADAEKPRKPRQKSAQADSTGKPPYKAKSDGPRLDRKPDGGKAPYKGKSDGGKSPYKGKSDGGKAPYKGKTDGAKAPYKGKTGDGKPDSRKKSGDGKPPFKDKSSGKFEGKPRKDARAGADARPKADAKDTSKRFTPPGGKGKPSKGLAKGAHAPPRRGKS